MAEVVLRRIQAGIETTRGTAVAATRKVYGTTAVTRVQPRKWAVEDRGMFEDKYRGNPELIDAGFTLTCDATFEDLPFYSALFYNGGISETGSGATGYTWTNGPDLTSDSLKTVTLEVGDESVAWQGPFGTVDTADFTFALDDTVKVALGGWVQDWLAPGLTGVTFTGFTPALAEHSVESVSGWQAKLYIDAAGGTPGTTQVTGRFKAGAWSYHNQNKRKYFGDGTALFSKLGRGRRQTHCQITFEALDINQYSAYWASPGLQEAIIRVKLLGTGIVGSTGPVPKEMDFDFYGYWDTFVLGNVDTNTTFQMDLQAVYDTTAAKASNIKVINGNSTL